MVGQMQLTLFLVFITLIHNNVAFSEIDSTISETNINKIVDSLLPNIRCFILQNGMDPMEIIDFSENIFPRLPGTMKGTINLKNGWLQNLSLLKRTGPVTADYEDKVVTLNMNLGFNVLDFNYEYYLKYLLYMRQGDVYGRFYDLDVNTVITVDLAHYKLFLESIKFSRVKNYDIKFEGHILDYVLNAVTKLITMIFHKRILTSIEERSMFIFGAKIDEWNRMLPQPKRAEIIQKWLKVPKEQFY